jgi:hypothetical protein
VIRVSPCIELRPIERLGCQPLTFETSLNLLGFACVINISSAMFLYYTHPDIATRDKFLSTINMAGCLIGLIANFDMLNITLKIIPWTTSLALLLSLLVHGLSKGRKDDTGKWYILAIMRNAKIDNYNNYTCDSSWVIESRAIEVLLMITESIVRTSQSLLPSSTSTFYTYLLLSRSKFRKLEAKADVAKSFRLEYFFQKILFEFLTRGATLHYILAT